MPHSPRLSSVPNHSGSANVVGMLKCEIDKLDTEIVKFSMCVNIIILLDNNNDNNEAFP